MTRIVTTLTLVLSAAVAWAGITVGVPVQIVSGEANQLPDKNIEVTYKQVRILDKAPAAIVAAIDSVTRIVSNNAGNGRTYSLMVSPQGKQIDVFNVDPLEPMGDRFKVMGTHIVGHFHFLVLATRDNQPMLDSVFKTTREKITYVREFEYVDEESSPLSTHVGALIDGGVVRIVNRLVEDMEGQ